MNALYAIKACVGGVGISAVKVLVESITLDDDIFPTYWCIPVFFVASIISYLNGKAKVPTVGILLQIAIFYKLQNIWLAVCLMGNLVARYQKCPYMDILKNRIIRILLWMVIFVAIKRPESNNTYMIDGICCTVMIMLIMRGTIVKRVLENTYMAAVGRQGMAIYILHPVCYITMGPVLFKWLSFLPYGWRFSAVLILCFFIIVQLSFPTMKLINTVTNYVTTWIAKIDIAMQRKCKSIEQ